MILSWLLRDPKKSIFSSERKPLESVIFIRTSDYQTAIIGAFLVRKCGYEHHSHIHFSIISANTFGLQLISENNCACLSVQT